MSTTEQGHYFSTWAGATTAPPPPPRGSDDNDYVIKNLIINSLTLRLHSVFFTSGAWIGDDQLVTMGQSVEQGGKKLKQATMERCL